MERDKADLVADLSRIEEKVDRILDNQKSSGLSAYGYFVIALGVAMFGIGATLPASLIGYSPSYILGGFSMVIIGFLMLSSPWLNHHFMKNRQKKSELKPLVNGKEMKTDNHQDSKFDSSLDLIDNRISDNSLRSRNLKSKIDVGLSVVKASPYFLVYTSAALITTMATSSDLASLPGIALAILIVVAFISWSQSKKWNKELEPIESQMLRDQAEFQDRKLLAADEFKRIRSWLRLGPQNYDQITIEKGIENWKIGKLSMEAGDKRVKDMEFIDEILIGKINKTIDTANDYYARCGRFYDDNTPLLNDCKARSALYKALSQTNYSLNEGLELVILYKTYLIKNLQNEGKDVSRELLRVKNSDEAKFRSLIQGEKAIDNGFPELLRNNDNIGRAVDMDMIRIAYGMQSREIFEETRYKFGKKVIELAD